METQNNNLQQNKFGHWLKTSITARMLMVGFLVIILLVPLSYINSLINERAFRQKDVVNEINKKWGNDVLVYGPILKLPYKTYSETKTFNEKTKTYFKETQTHIKYAYIFPEHLNATVDVNSKTLKRGNFESAVFTTTMDFTGNYIPVDLTAKGIKQEDIVWNEASIIIKTSNLKGIKSEVQIKLEDKAYSFETNFNQNTNSRLDVLESALIKNEDLFKTKNTPFSFSMTFNGSRQIELIPIGKTTTMHMNSNWADPSFMGNYLPNDETKSITKDGFKADWKILHINRAFSQQHLKSIPKLSQFAFGTKFMVMVDEYQKSERSAKYGFLVIGLTFLVFFLIQTLSKIHIHPFQYLMIGLALTMFYTLLVSLSEHSNFLKAYVISGASVIVLITLYSKSILKTFKFPIFIGLSLTGLYAFIYVIIQLENYALLVGSIGLFLILAIVMFVSRKIDWHNG
ncbi:cell envelope integrity protein CreD [Algibacter amylolyticus]|uniref:Cell envelope integrity protein CreD n=1 Tax=Algibacter amylolyticus TaxID=1608400 RepID=A0A5M7B9R8_9FLAO|nr:cell envelope integrity protein CreD [Algibacter amylolyticus]KAA5824065.1 cell envelope integrity protein CreD [Algibacter amylolyticus]MBB5269619.1 inner membrane protein [Algibacter amylolyticus]TSJ74542.1 cell envelope integrity protein CreD [Algibacter amylolyticus]